MLTGVSWDVFEILYAYLKADGLDRKNSIPQKDQLLLTLIKLIFTISFDLLAYCRSIAKSTMNKNNILYLKTSQHSLLFVLCVS